MVAAIPDLLWWVIVIFVAGIIGQFGKSLSLKVLDFFSGEKEGEQEVVEEPVELMEEVDPKELKKRAKAEKKRRKMQAKARKKAEDGGL